VVDFKNNCESISQTKPALKAVKALRSWEMEVKKRYGAKDHAAAEENQPEEIEVEKDSTGLSLKEILGSNQSTVYYKDGSLAGQIKDPDLSQARRNTIGLKRGLPEFLKQDEEHFQYKDQGAAKRRKFEQQDLTEDQKTLLYAQMALRNQYFKPVPFAIEQALISEPEVSEHVLPINEATKYYLTCLSNLNEIEAPQREGQTTSKHHLALPLSEEHV